MISLVQWARLWQHAKQHGVVQPGFSPKYRCVIKLYQQESVLYTLRQGANRCRTCSWCANLLARALLREKTVDPRPKGQSLASATASSSVLNLRMVKTGPKTSSLQGKARYSTSQAIQPRASDDLSPECDKCAGVH